MGSGKRVVLLAVVMALAFCAGGCVDREVNGDEATYSFSWWVPTLATLAVVIGVPVGLLLRNVRTRRRAGWGVLVAALIAGVGLVPSLFLDRVKVDSDHFETRTGFWFAPTKHNVPFDGLGEIRHVTYQTRGRRGRKTTKHKLVCVRDDGAVADTVQLGDLARRATPEILERAQDRLVRVTTAQE